MRVLITGGAGFIGSHLAEELIKNKIEVGIVDDHETGNPENIPDSKYVWSQNVDICIYDYFYPIFRFFDPDIVVHAAASYKDPNHWHRDTEVNCTGTANVLECAREFKRVRKIIYLQTSLCYGNVDSQFPIKITQPINPVPNSYAITKTCAEQLIAMSGIPFISFRLANCYGPRNLSGAIPAFYRNILIGKEVYISTARRDFVYVSDLVRLLVRAVCGEGKGNYYHVSSGKDISILELFNIISRILHKTVSHKLIEVENDVGSILLDPSKTMLDFPGWKTLVSLESGLQEAIKWYDKNPVGETYTHLRVNK